VAKFIGMEDFGFKVLIMCEQVLLLKQNPQVEWKRIKIDANDRDNEEKNVISIGRWIECWEGRWLGYEGHARDRSGNTAGCCKFLLKRRYARSIEYSPN